jgi:hypothetical protein
MPLPTPAVLSLILLGSALGVPTPGLSQETIAASPPQARPVTLTPELSAPMFHGTVHLIDRQALRVTIRTDFGRLVPVTVGSCQIIQWLQIGDRVRLDVDAQGIVRALEKPTGGPSATPGTPLPSGWQPDRCPEAAA